MKKITEMTRQEILALTDEQIIALMDYECAEQGIPLLPEPTAPTIDTPKPDIVYYQCHGVSFFKREDAEALSEFLLSKSVAKEQWDTSWKNRFMVAEEKDEFVVNALKGWSQSGIAEARVKLTAAQTTEEKYAADKKKYDEARDRRDEACRYILRARENAYSDQYREDHLRQMFDQYVKLANGDKWVAMRFLEKVEDVPKELREELCPPVVLDQSNGARISCITQSHNV